MLLSKRMARATCAEIIHPWTESCLEGYRTIMCASCVGSCKMFFPLMLVKCAIKVLKKKKFDKQIAMDCLIEYFQCVILGTCITTTLLVYNCMFRYLLGKYTLWSLIFVPGLLAGLSCIIIRPKLRIELSPAFSNAALESFVITMCHLGLIPLNTYTETLFFMATNACLMYTSKVFKSNLTNYSWFFKPDSEDSNTDGKLFSQSLFKKTKTYFTIGIGFGILRTLIADITILVPKNMHKLFKINTLKPGIFAGTYVAVYEFIVYILNRCFRIKNKTLFTLPAGFLAGLSYAIDPNLSINLSVFINLVQILYNRIDMRLLRLIPMDTICFSLSAGTLFHIQLFHTKSISKVGSKFIKLTTSRKSDLIVEAINKLTNNIF